MNIAKPLFFVGLIVTVTLALEHFGPRFLTELQRNSDYDALPAVQPLPQAPQLPPQAPASRHGPEQLLPDQPTKHGTLQSAKRLVMNALPAARQIMARSIAQESQDYIDRHGHLPTNFYFGSARTTPVDGNFTPPDPSDAMAMEIYYATQGAGE